MARERLKDAALSAALGAGAAFFATTLELPGLLSIWSDPFWIVLLCAGIAGVCGAYSRAARRFAFAALIGAEVLYAVVALSPLSRTLTKNLTRRDALPAAADAVFVFGSQVYPDGVLGDVAASRLVHGLEVVKGGHAPRVVLADAYAPSPKFSEAARGFMDRLAVKAELIALGPVRDSHDESVAAAELFRRRGWSRVIAVTSPTHSRRACAALEAQGLTVFCSPSIETDFDLETLGRPEDRIAAFGVAIHEQVGYRVYKGRGWIK